MKKDGISNCEYCPTPKYIIEEFDVSFTSGVNQSNCFLTTFPNGQVFFAYETTGSGMERVYGQSFDQNLNRNGEEVLLSEDGSSTFAKVPVLGTFAQQKGSVGTSDEETINGNEYFLLGYNRYDGTKWKIDLQVVSSSGQRINKWWEVSIGDDDTDPVIICREDNVHCDLVWVSKPGLSDEVIYIQQFNLVDHTTRVPQNLVSSDGYRNMEPHGVQIPSSNEYVIAFTKYYGGTGDSINTIVYDFETESKYDIFQINLLSHYSVQKAKVAILKNVERYMVTWETCSDPNECNIHGTILDYQHTILIEEFVINSQQTGRQHLPSIVAVEQLSAFAVSWMSPAEDSEGEIILTRLIGTVANPTIYLTDAIEISTANGTYPVSAMLSINNNVDHDRYRNEITMGLVSQNPTNNNKTVRCLKIKFPIAESEFQLKDVSFINQTTDLVWRLKTPIFKNYDSTYPILNIRAIQSNGTALPEYLIYDELKSQFKIRANNTIFESALRICLTYENECFLESKTCFNLQTVKTTSCSNVITQIGSIEDHHLETNERFSFHLSGSKYFQKSSSNDQFYYRASLDSGDSLPDWINFDPVDLEFWGMAPSANQEIFVQLSVMNQCGETNSDIFGLVIITPGSRCPSSGLLDIENPIQDQIVTRGTRFTFLMPPNTVVYQGGASDYSNPLQFESDNLDADLSFLVVRPKNSQDRQQRTQVMWTGLINDPKDYNITLTITDECNTIVSQWFLLKFPACDCPNNFEASPEIRVSSIVNGEQVNAQMAWNEDLERIIYVFKAKFESYDDEILSRTFDIDLLPVSDNSHINDYNTNLQDNPHISNIHVDMIDYRDISLVVWYADGGDGHSSGLFGRTIDSTGSTISQETQLNIETADIQKLPIVVTIGNAYISPQFLTLWQSNNQDGSGYGIYGRTWDTKLNPLSSEVQINVFTESHQQCVDASVITIRKKARIFIVWNSMEQDGSQEGIYGKVIDHGFNIVKDEFKINEETQYDQTEGRVTSLQGTERFIVTWSGNYGTEFKNRIYYKIYDSDGNVIRSDTAIYVPEGNSQDNPTISGFGFYKFIIAWQTSNPSQGGSVLYAELFDLTGARIDPTSYFTLAKENIDNQNPEIIELRTTNKLALSFEYLDATEYLTYTKILSSDHPSKGNDIPDQEIKVNQNFEIMLPSDTFSDHYGDDATLVYNLNIKINSMKAKNIDWLQYDQYNQKLYGMAPNHEFDDLQIEIYCLDKCYAYNTTQLTLSNKINNRPCSEEMHVETLKNLINNTNDETLIINTCCSNSISAKYYVDSSAPIVTFNSYNNVNFNLHNNGMCSADPHSITFENRQATGDSGGLKFINSKYITFQTNSNIPDTDQSNTIIFDDFFLELTQNSYLIFYNKAVFQNFDPYSQNSWIIINENSYVQFSSLQFYDISLLNKENGYLYVNSSQLILNNFGCTNCLKTIENTARQENYLIQIDNNDSQQNKVTHCEDLFSLNINSMDYSDQNVLILENCLITNTLKSNNNKIVLIHSNAGAEISLRFLDLINSQFVNQMESKFLLHIHELIYFDYLLIDNFNLIINSTNIGAADDDIENLNQLHNRIHLIDTTFTNGMDSKTKAINLTLVCESSNTINNYGQWDFDPNSRLLTNNNHSSPSDDSTLANHGVLSFVNDFEIDINLFNCHKGSELKLTHTNDIFPKLFINHNSEEFEGTINNDFSGYTERQDFGQIIECLIYGSHDDFNLKLVEEFDIQNNDQFVWEKRIDGNNVTVELIGCPIGEYSIGAQHSCERCEPGTFSDGVGTTSCSACLMGSFANGYGSSTCLHCSAGNYADAEGSSKCSRCDPGKYQDSEGGKECKNCPVGYFQSNSQATRCQICPAGTFANTAGLSICSSCSPGTFQDSEGQLQCKNCPVGYFQSNSQATRCHFCPAGTYGYAEGSSKCSNCGPGTYQDLEGRSECKNCPVGYFQEREQGSSCKICAAGTYGDAEGLSKCSSCEPGTYQYLEGRMKCIDCSIGYYQDSEQATSCQVCAAGTYSDATRLTKCFNCDPGTYQDAMGQSTCRACDAGSYSSRYGSVNCDYCPYNEYQSSKGKRECEFCPINSITLRNGVNTAKECLCEIGHLHDATACKECPLGAVCDKVGLLYPESRPGYWHSDEQPNTFSECEVFDACPGGKTNLCNEELGYTGEKCGQCVTGFYKLYHRCEICTNQTQKLILLLFLFIIFVILIIWVAQKGKNYFGAFSILISFIQILAILPKMNIWPKNFTQFLSYLSVVNFNIELLGLECSINLSYTQKWFLIMALPVFLLLLLIFIYVLYNVHSLFVKCVGETFLSKFPRFITRPGKENTNKYIYLFSAIRFQFSKFFTHGYSKEQLKNLRNIFINVYVANLFLVHLIITLKVLEMFDCKKTSNGDAYLEAAPEVQCYGETWYKILPYAIAFIIVYIIGIPAFIIWILWFHASRYGEDVFNSRLSLLCGRYEKEYFYWELFVISRKLFIVFCEIYLTDHPLIQIIVCLIVVLVAILLQSEFTPYNSTTRNMMEFSCLCITQIIFIAGLVFISKDVKKNNLLFNRLSNFLIFLILLGLIIFGIISLIEMKSRISLKKKKSKKKKVIKNLSKLAQLRQSPEIQFLKKKPQLLLLLKVFATLKKKEIKNIKSFYKSLSKNLFKNFEKNNNYSLDKASLINKFVVNWKEHLVPLFIHWYNTKSNSLQKIRAVQLFISFSSFKIHLLQNKQSKIIDD
ncbi:insulin-like growth factor binding protein [Anaeramoeba flamelloides]|uniref:Insulin-like growth factor binding protein n=1 Tax=Anaeramoeba flamelloides TaxID=1746091 RepID=A0ABQ8Z4G3_9EUKA|nr:insulin-like growth factor binding protein [Anaeramoeba flamelloides]